MGSRLIEHLAKHATIRVSLPFISYEIEAEDLLSKANIDTRIARLSEVKSDLQESIVAIEEVQAEAATRKSEFDTLSTMVKQLQEDRATAETLLKVPQDRSRQSLRGRRPEVAYAVSSRVPSSVSLLARLPASLSGTSLGSTLRYRDRPIPRR